MSLEKICREKKMKSCFSLIRDVRGRHVNFVEAVKNITKRNLFSRKEAFSPKMEELGISKKEETLEEEQGKEKNRKDKRELEKMYVDVESELYFLDDELLGLRNSFLRKSEIKSHKLHLLQDKTILLLKWKVELLKRDLEKVRDGNIVVNEEWKETDVQGRKWSADKLRREQERLKYHIRDLQNDIHNIELDQYLKYTRPGQLAEYYWKRQSLGLVRDDQAWPKGNREENELERQDLEAEAEEDAQNEEEDAQELMHKRERLEMEYKMKREQQKIKKQLEQHKKMRALQKEGEAITRRQRQEADEEEAFETRLLGMPIWQRDQEMNRLFAEMDPEKREKQATYQKLKKAKQKGEWLDESFPPVAAVPEQGVTEQEVHTFLQASEEASIEIETLMKAPIDFVLRLCVHLYKKPVSVVDPDFEFFPESENLDAKVQEAKKDVSKRLQASEEEVETHKVTYDEEETETDEEVEKRMREGREKGKKRESKKGNAKKPFYVAYCFLGKTPSDQKSLKPLISNFLSLLHPMFRKSQTPVVVHLLQNFENEEEQEKEVIVPGFNIMQVARFLGPAQVFLEYRPMYDTLLLDYASGQTSEKLVVKNTLEEGEGEYVSLNELIGAHDLYTIEFLDNWEQRREYILRSNWKLYSNLPAKGAIVVPYHTIHFFTKGLTRLFLLPLWNTLFGSFYFLFQEKQVQVRGEAKEEKYFYVYRKKPGIQEQDYREVWEKRSFGLQDLTLVQFLLRNNFAPYEGGNLTFFYHDDEEQDFALNPIHNAR